MPLSNSLEFNTFVRENIFFVIKPTVNAIKTIFVPYGKYVEIRKLKRKTKQIYSYAREEYMVKGFISLEDCLCLCVDSRNYNGMNNGMSEREVIERIIELMKFYDIKLPLIDFATKKVIYQEPNLETTKIER